MIVLAIVIVVLWGTAFLLLFRIPTCERSTNQHDYPKVSVIVPARNEERNLPRLLKSLAGEEVQPQETIVVDDGSTDRTADVARAAGATVLVSRPLPDGWRGKTWACAQGAHAASGEILLFVDADTFFEKGGLRSILDTYREGAGALSVGAYHRVERPYEELSAFFNILMTAGTGAFVIAGRNRPPAGLFGPFLMVDCDSYDAVGGHETVKDKILENFCLARKFQNHGILTRCFGGKGTFSMRMYPEGVRSLIQGWSKAFASGAAQTPPWIVLGTAAWMTGAILAAAYLVLGAFVGGLTFLVGAGLYLLFVLQLWSVLRRIGSFRPGTALFYPVPLLFCQVLFARSMILRLCRRHVSWKGREIPTEFTRK